MQDRSELIVLDRFPDRATEAWQRLIRDVVGGPTATSAWIAALDEPADRLLQDVDADALLADDAPPIGTSAGPAPVDDGQGTVTADEPPTFRTPAVV